MTQSTSLNNTDYEVISETKSLEDFCQRVIDSGETLLGLDTEFHRERSYYPILCVLQVATPTHSAVIDCLADNIDLSSFDALLLRKDKVKILHSARQDIEIFIRRLGVIPRPLFDTQIAAMACGFGEQVSLSHLLKDTAHISVDKAVRYSDWRKRPLTKRQLDYAVEDALYLPYLYQWFDQKLSELQRHSWIEDEMAKLLTLDFYMNDPKKAWERIKTGGRIKGESFNILKALAECRETLAQKKDLPRNFICHDRSLLDMAAKAPRDKAALEKINNLPQGFVKSGAGTLFLKAVETGSKAVYTPVQQERFIKNDYAADLLKLLLKHYCRTEKLSSLLVASAQELAELASLGKNANIRAISGWRYDFFGKDALSLLQGDISLSLSGDKLLINFECNH